MQRKNTHEMQCKYFRTSLSERIVDIWLFESEHYTTYDGKEIHLSSDEKTHQRLYSENYLNKISLIRKEMIDSLKRKYGNWVQTKLTEVKKNSISQKQNKI